MENIPRLDVLLYAHDGRGLGHASRTIAVGMALRRLYPKLRVLFISGCNISQELMGAAPLDWLKLPSYETQVIDGKSKGISGKSNYTDNDLGKLRTEQLLQVAQLYRPKVVLVDHSPQGKHRELLAAIEESKSFNSTWILGIRAVMGKVGQLQSDLATSLFKNSYGGLLWYGDSAVLGSSQLAAIHQQFATHPIECGYVSRLAEITRPDNTQPETTIAVTVSIPWLGERTPSFLQSLYAVLQDIGDSYGKWHIYLDYTETRAAQYRTLFDQLPFCSIRRPSQKYIHSLIRSRCAVIYGGYNSLMDVLSLSLPSLVILRDMQDDEQKQHLENLVKSTDHLLTPLPEQCSTEDLAAALIRLLKSQDLHKKKIAVNLNGAELAANHIYAVLKETAANR